MISRYSLPEMTQIWSDRTKYKMWFMIERAVLDANVELGLAPEESLRKLDEFDVYDDERLARISEIESEVKHDVIAFLTELSEKSPMLSRYLHIGMTSSDLVDTGLACLLKRAGDIILKRIDDCIAGLLDKAELYRTTLCIGRSHGIHAEPTTFGLKILGWFAEMNRQRTRFLTAWSEVCVGKISGAVGNFANIAPEIEERVLKSLALNTEPIATQVVARDRHLVFMNSLAAIGTSLERFCVEIRHLQRTEVGEVREEFGKGQKGSSAMPHKRNPIVSENICGLARVLRGYAAASAENVVLWHERDISHSSCERIIIPDALLILDFMLDRFKKLISGLVVNEDRMLRNISLTDGAIFSEQVMLLLVNAGMTKEDAYKEVQKAALEAASGEETFRKSLCCNENILQYTSAEDINKIFQLSDFTAKLIPKVSYIFDRVSSN